MIVDPSHAAGRRALVLPLARAAVAVGADGIIVEAHPRPEEALCDGPQQIPADEFGEFAREVAELVGPDGQADRLVQIVRLAIVGTGLIGASVGLAAKRGGATVVGFDEERATAEVAAERGAVDEVGARRSARRCGAPSSRSSPCRSGSSANRRCRRCWRRAASSARSPTSARRRPRCARLPAARRGSSAAIRSAARRRAVPSMRAPTCSTAPPGSSRRCRRASPTRYRLVHGFVGELGSDAGRGRPGGARPARRADEPPASRPGERPRQPGRRDADRRAQATARPRAARCGT